MSTTFTKAAIGLMLACTIAANAKPATDVYNGHRGKSFNTGWMFHLGDTTNAQAIGFNDAAWHGIAEMNGDRARQTLSELDRLYARVRPSSSA